MHFFTNINIGDGTKTKSKTIKVDFKPVQAGIILSTKSVIELTDYLITQHKYLFVLAGRLTQDCVENLFSLIRAKNIIPNALQFKHNLKLIAVSQYLKPCSNTSYDEDDRSFIGISLPNKKLNKELEPKLDNYNILLPVEINPINVKINNIELNILYNIAGYIINSISENQAVCKTCIDSAGSKTLLPKITYSKFVQLKCYCKHSLFFVNKKTFLFFLEMEKIIRIYLPILKNLKLNLKEFLTYKMSDLTSSHLYTCHNLSSKIKARFIIYRARIVRTKLRKETKVYSSKSMAMHTLIH